MTANLKPLCQRLLSSKQVQFVSFSVTPWEDSVPVLKQYEKENKINGEKWHLLTGGTGAIYTLARQSFFAEEDAGYTKDSTEFLHTEHVMLVDSDLHLRGVYNGTLALEMDRLKEDIEKLTAEQK
jgi:protein SCO1/2